MRSPKACQLLPPCFSSTSHRSRKNIPPFQSATLHGRNKIQSVLVDNWGRLPPTTWLTLNNLGADFNCKKFSAKRQKTWAVLCTIPPPPWSHILWNLNWLKIEPNLFFPFLPRSNALTILFFASCNLNVQRHRVTFEQSEGRRYRQLIRIWSSWSTFPMPCFLHSSVCLWVGGFYCFSPGGGGCPMLPMFGCCCQVLTADSGSLAIPATKGWLLGDVIHFKRCNASHS